jgi:hypothetical protein
MFHPQPIIKKSLQAMPGIFQTILETYPTGKHDFLAKPYFDIGFAEGYKEGYKEGYAVGYAKGLAKVKAEQESIVIHRIVESGLLTPEQIAEILQVPLERVLQIQQGK